MGNRRHETALFRPTALYIDTEYYVLGYAEVLRSPLVDKVLAAFHLKVFHLITSCDYSMISDVENLTEPSPNFSQCCTFLQESVLLHLCHVKL